MRKPLLVFLTFLVSYLGCLAWFSGSEFAGGVSKTAAVLATLATDAPLAALWMTSAGGIGLLLRRACAAWATDRVEASTESRNPFVPCNLLNQIAIELPLGIGGLLVLDTWLGMLGAFGAGGSALGWAVLLVPSILWIRAISNEIRDGNGLGIFALVESQTGVQIISIALVLGAICGLGSIAASSTPLWLWSSEFGGYDALSYHLELPKRWMLAGSSGNIDGNVYSHFPGFVEHAFLHLMIVRGNPWQGAVTCQWLASLFALTTAFVSWRLARTLLPTTERGFAFIAPMLMLTLPWMLVVGTLAYNDTIPVLLLGAGWLLIARIPPEDPAARSVSRPTLCAVAFLAAIACGAKPTALLFTAIPLASLVLLRLGWRSLVDLPLTICIGAAVLFPWFLKNYAETENPVFPFATSIFGLGHWTQEQANIFNAAHSADLAWTERLRALWQEFFAHGIGERPRPNEPWYPQWGLLPVLGLACAFLLAWREGIRSSTPTARALGLGALVMLALQVIAWLFATHLKSRFMLPAAMPLAIAVTLALSPMLLRRGWKSHVSLGCLVLALLPVAVFLREPARGGVHAPAAFVDGLAQAHGDLAFAMYRNATTEQERAETLALLPSTIIADELIPPNANVLALGLATPFHFHRPIDSSTVWDRGALEEVAQEHLGHPERWRDALTTRGYTHLLVQPTMLEVWRQSGWLNPVLDLPSLGQFVQTIRPVMRCSDGVIVYMLEAPPQAAAPVPAAPTAPPPPLLTPLPTRSTPG